MDDVTRRLKGLERHVWVLAVVTGALVVAVASQRYGLLGWPDRVQATEVHAVRVVLSDESGRSARIWAGGLDFRSHEEAASVWIAAGSQPRVGLAGKTVTAEDGSLTLGPEGVRVTGPDGSVQIPKGPGRDGGEAGMGR